MKPSERIFAIRNKILPYEQRDPESRRFYLLNAIMDYLDEEYEKKQQSPVQPQESNVHYCQTGDEPKQEPGKVSCTQEAINYEKQKASEEERNTACAHAGDSGKYPGCSCVTCNKPLEPKQNDKPKPKETRPYLKALLGKGFQVIVNVDDDEANEIAKWCSNHDIFWGSISGYPEKPKSIRLLLMGAPSNDYQKFNRIEYIPSCEGEEAL